MSVFPGSSALVLVFFLEEMKRMISKEDRLLHWRYEISPALEIYPNNTKGCTPDRMNLERTSQLELYFIWNHQSNHAQMQLKMN